MLLIGLFSEISHFPRDRVLLFPWSLMQCTVSLITSDLYRVRVAISA